MALTADYTKIKDYKTLVYIPNDPDDPDAGITLNPVTHSLVFACMAVGLGEITEKNVDKFATRLRMWEIGTGSFLQNAENGNLTDRLITYAEVRAHIGLHTNAFPNLTDAAFGKELIRVMTDRAQRKIEFEKEGQS